MKINILIIGLLLFGISNAQNKYFTSEEITINPLLDGLLLVPKTEGETSTLAIIIQGSGPTDRDGNQPMANNNSLKYLAEGLSKKGIATFRYDKRLVKLARMGRLKEEDIVFDHFITDALAVLNHFLKDNRFDKIVIIGHSEGSLVGMVAARGKADAFVSIAGAGQQIDDLIVDQLGRQAPYLKDDARNSFDDLRVNGVAKNFGEGLISIFRPSVQPFMRTWMEYDPQKEIAKLDIPVFILNGDQDVQVDENEALLLQQAKPDAEFLIIKGMNHIFKKITRGDTMENAKSYNEPRRPVMPELIEVIAKFIKELD